MDVVIVGNGIAGNSVAFKIKELDRDANITILSPERCLEYSPGALPYYLSGEVSRDAVFLRDEDRYRSQDITLSLGHALNGVELENKRVVMDNGSRIDYDKLVLALGGRAAAPPISGIDKKGVFFFKTLEDTEKLASHKGRVAVIVGSGPIGMEVGEALWKKGYKVYVIEMLDWILPQAFDEELADLWSAHLIKQGMDIFSHEKVLKIEGDDSVTSVVTDKRGIKCDTVVMSTGVVPNTSLFAGSEVKTGNRRGILVDKKMETSVDDVYACGDCIETFDAFSGEETMYMLQHNAIDQAEVVAKNCLGQDVEYRGAWNFTRVHLLGMYGVSVGKTAKQMKNGYEIKNKKDGTGCLRVITDNDRIAGFQAVGTSSRYCGVLLGTMKRGDALDTILGEKTLGVNSPSPWNWREINRCLRGCE